MKISLIALVMIILLTGCTQNNNNQIPSEINNTTNNDYNQKPINSQINQTINYTNKNDSLTYNASSPVSELNENDIQSLNINCSGSNNEIADCILNWQRNNLLYTGGSAKLKDAVDPIRWNYFLPGIYTSHDILFNKRNSDNKIYGICFDYAITYCSIADYYGLECRIMNSLSKPSDGISSYSLPTTGLAEEEYNRLKIRLDELGLDYPYEAVRLVAYETPSHYWAEVRLNSEWVVKDGSEGQNNLTGTTQTNFKNNNDFEVTNWTSNDKTDELINYTLRIASGEDLRSEGYNSSLEQFTEGREINKNTSYTGITDDLGNQNRAVKIDDFMQGFAIAPYFNNCSAVCNFFSGTISNCENECNSESSFYDCYETCSGEKFYKVCDFICEEDATYAECYESCSGEELDVNCNENC